MRTRVKICGITRVEDCKFAVKQGVDAIGLNFSYEAEARCITVEQAQQLLQCIPAFVSSVAIFTNQTQEDITAVLQVCHFDLLQFHGNEPPDFCRSFAVPYLKAIAMQDGLDVRSLLARYPDSKGFILDSYTKARAGGGVGKVFSWGRIAKDLAPHIILAGGLTADNVATAISQVRPFAVDVCGGVETDYKGIKDHDKIIHFLQEVRRGDIEHR